MALKIKDTPVLKGKDAKIFRNNIDSSLKKKLPKKELLRMQENFKILSSLSEK